MTRCAFCNDPVPQEPGFPPPDRAWCSSKCRYAWEHPLPCAYCGDQRPRANHKVRACKREHEQLPRPLSALHALCEECAASNQALLDYSNRRHR